MQGSPKQAVPGSVPQVRVLCRLKLRFGISNKTVGEARSAEEATAHCQLQRKDRAKAALPVCRAWALLKTMLYTTSNERTWAAAVRRTRGYRHSNATEHMPKLGTAQGEQPRYPENHLRSETTFT